MAAIDRALVLTSLLLAALACDDGGLHVSTPSPPSDDGEWDEELPPDEGPPGGLEDGGDEGSAASVLVAPGDTWHYESGLAAAPEWISVEFDDASWASGPAPLGVGFEVGTALPPGPNRLRTEFELADPSGVAGLLLRLRRDDGAIAWLNGVEVFRSNMPASGVDPGLSAESRAVDYDPYHYYRAFPDPSLLRAGTNVLAVSLHPHASDDDLVVDVLLQIIDPEVPPEELGFQIRTLGYGGEYGPKNVGAIWIEDANGFVRTLEVWGDVRREHLIAWRLASDENDVDAVTASTRSTHGTHLANWDLRRFDGTPAAPGLYRLRVEYTEANSNGSDPAGPQLAIEFELGAGPHIIDTPTSGDSNRFAELLLHAP